MFATDLEDTWSKYIRKNHFSRRIKTARNADVIVIQMVKKSLRILRDSTRAWLPNYHWTGVHKYNLILELRNELELNTFIKSELFWILLQTLSRKGFNMFQEEIYESLQNLGQSIGKDKQSLV